MYPQDVGAYKSGMQVKGHAKSTQYQRISILRHFLEDLIAEGILAFNPVPKAK